MSRVLQPCGTAAAYQRHMRRGEPPCEACAVAWSEWSRAYKGAHREQIRAEQRNRRVYGGHELAPCGTRSAYQRHLYNLEKPCFACQVASARYHAERRANRKAAADAS